MQSLIKLKIRHKLPFFLVLFAAFTSAVLVTVSTVNYQQNAWNVVQQKFDSLLSDRGTALESLFDNIKSDAEMLAAFPSTATAVQRLSAGWSSISDTPSDTLRQMYIDDNPNAPDERYLLDRGAKTVPYNIHHATFHKSFRQLLANKGYTDAYLINIAGDIIYSVAKRDEFALNLLGSMKGSPFGEFFASLSAAEGNQIELSDFAPYAPRGGKPTAFVGTRLEANGGQTVGFLVLQISTDMIDKIVDNTTGLGNSTEVYVVGPDTNARSTSRFEGGHKFLQPLPQLAQIAAAQTDGPYFLTDSLGLNGEKVVSHSHTLTGPNGDWIIIVEQNRDEVLAPGRHDRNLLILTSLLSALIMVVIGWKFARGLLKPIDRLCESMQAIGSGNHDVSIPEANRQDEFGQMGQTLLVMRDGLKAAQDEQDARKNMQAEQDTVVHELSTGLAHLAEGDLSHQITVPFAKEHETLRNNFNHAIQKLRSVVLQVVDTAHSIQNGSTEISQASDELSQRTEAQAATLEQTAAALDELTASVKSAADSAKSVESIVTDATDEAKESDLVVRGTVEAMTKIESSSSKISEILTVIDDISFQTNLLALNAGVEAARAGEAGRGFAVVASEVRALALRSSTAAMQIKEIISESSSHIGEGVERVGQTGEALRAIVERITHISGLISEIASSAADQSTNLAEINTGMTQLDQVTQQNAAMVEESTAASHLLSSDSNSLAKYVAHFDAGKVAPPAPRDTKAVQVDPPIPSNSIEDHVQAGEPELETDLPISAMAPAHTGNAAQKLWQDF